MKKILVEVSAGELLDKLSILEIKLQKITNKESLKIIDKEYNSLKNTTKEHMEISNYSSSFEELKIINNRLWDIENEKRLCEKNSNFSEKFIKLSRDVHFLNDKRAAIKLKINKDFGSSIEEVKEYTKY